MLNVIYKTYLGDEDSKGYKAVVDDKPYGTEFEIEKKDCMNEKCSLNALMPKCGVKHLNHFT